MSTASRTPEQRSTPDDAHRPAHEAWRPTNPVRETEKSVLVCSRCGGPLEVPDGAADKLSRMVRRGAKLPLGTCRECDRVIRQGAQKSAAQRRQRQVAVIRRDARTALKSCGVPPRYADAAFDCTPDLPESLIARAKAWAVAPAGIVYLTSASGQVGAGKTWLAVAMLRAVLTEGSLPPNACRYVAERQYLRELKAGYEEGRGDRPAARLAKDHPYNVQLLLYDDLGSASMSDWSKDQIVGLIEQRHASCLPTVITSNFTPTKLAEMLDPRLASRIAQDQAVWALPTRDLRVVGSLNMQTTPLQSTPEGHNAETQHRVDISSEDPQVVGAAHHER